MFLQYFPSIYFRLIDALASPKPKSTWFSKLWLRIYPWPFARAMVDMLEDLKESACGTPPLPKLVPAALDCFTGKWVRDSRDWRYIDFGEVYNYLRGSRKLQIPPNWRGIIPDRLG